MISEVERNQKLVRVNDVLTYIDSENYEKIIVTQLFKGGFVAKDETEQEDVYFFSELQLGWKFSEKTKKQNRELLRLQYA
jgi:hypothetical protein